mgnify:CR=1 FL=1
MSSVQIQEFTVKDEEAFRIRVRYWKAISPKDLNSIEFVQECMRDGEVDFSSTYNFLMTDDEIKLLIKGLESI